MKTLVIKGQDQLWPTVTWADSNLSILYLGSKDDDVTLREAKSVDFEEFFLHLDKGGSIFLTVKQDTPDRYDGKREETGFRRALKTSFHDTGKTLLEQGDGLSAMNLETEEIRSWS